MVGGQVVVGDIIKPQLAVGELDLLVQQATLSVLLGQVRPGSDLSAVLHVYWVLRCHGKASGIGQYRMRHTRTI